MLLVKQREALRSELSSYKKNKKSIGFVPTMGALHEGHLSLISASNKENDITVCSIFVNPAQFNNATDLQKYPVTLEADIRMLEEAACDIVFIPSKSEIYPEEYVARKYDLGHLEKVLEGKFRPGHFQGVCQVVEILLRTVSPDKLYLGQKDLQQCRVIQRLLEITGLDKDITPVICETLREKDGLAMSSRNMRLNNEERKNALSISRALYSIVRNAGKGSPAELKRKAVEEMEANALKVEYVEIANAETLMPIQSWNEKNIAALAAAFSGEIRLIDNMLVRRDEQ